MTEPRFEKRGAFRVLGVEDAAGNIEEVDPGFNELWMNRFMSRHDEIQPHSVDGAYYGVWFGTNGIDLTQGTYLAGMAVLGNPLLPDGWVIKTIPEAEYAVFESTLRDIGDATEYGLGRWMPNSDYERDFPKPRFDLMPPNTADQESRVSVWIPVRRKT
jgi:predicted transcriptional regulator YdeE